MFNLAEYYTRYFLETKFKAAYNDSTNADINAIFDGNAAAWRVALKAEMTTWLKKSKPTFQMGYSLEALESLQNPVVSIMFPAETMTGEYIGHNEEEDVSGVEASYESEHLFDKSIIIQIISLDPDTTNFMKMMIEQLINSNLTEYLDEDLLIYEQKGWGSFVPEYLQNEFPRYWITGLHLDLKVGNQYIRAGSATETVTEVDLSHTVTTFPET